MAPPKKVLMTFFDHLAKNWPSVLKKLHPDGAGHRLFPSSTSKKDKMEGFRADQGPQHSNDQDKFNINIQVNNEGEASHEKILSFTVSKSKAMGEDEVKELLTKSAEDKGII
jgi:hypothetical protein